MAAGKLDVCGAREANEAMARGWLGRLAIRKAEAANRSRGVTRARLPRGKEGYGTPRSGSPDGSGSGSESESGSYADDDQEPETRGIADLTQAMSQADFDHDHDAKTFFMGHTVGFWAADFPVLVSVACRLLGDTCSCIGDACGPVWKPWTPRVRPVRAVRAMSESAPHISADDAMERIRDGDAGDMLVQCALMGYLSSEVDDAIAQGTRTREQRINALEAASEAAFVSGDAQLGHWSVWPTVLGPADSALSLPSSLIECEELHERVEAAGAETESQLVDLALAVALSEYDAADKEYMALRHAANRALAVRDRLVTEKAGQDQIEAAAARRATLKADLLAAKRNAQAAKLAVEEAGGSVPHANCDAPMRPSA